MEKKHKGPSIIWCSKRGNMFALKAFKVKHLDTCGQKTQNFQHAQEGCTKEYTTKAFLAT